MDGDGYVSSMPTDIDLFIGVNMDPDRGWVKVDAGCAQARCYGIGCNWWRSDGTAGGNSGFVDPEGNVMSEAGTGEKIICETLPLPWDGPPVATRRFEIIASPTENAVAAHAPHVYDLIGRRLAERRSATGVGTLVDPRSGAPTVSTNLLH
jgi:hypothetical protein